MIRCCLRRQLPGVPLLGTRHGKYDAAPPVRNTHSDEGSVTKVHPSAVNVVSDIDIKYIVMGMGNVDFLQTRHSLGMRVVTFMSNELKGSKFLRDKPLLAHVSKVTLPTNDTILLMKSTLAMNASGKSLRKGMDKYLLTPYQIIVVHDDMELEPGEVVWKDGGSSQGHNGVRSAMSSLESDSFMRVRVGIGKPFKERDVDEHVMGKLKSSVERKKLAMVIHKATQMILDHVCPPGRVPQLRKRGPGII